MCAIHCLAELPGFHGQRHGLPSRSRFRQSAQTWPFTPSPRLGQVGFFTFLWYMKKQDSEFQANHRNQANLTYKIRETGLCLKKIMKIGWINVARNTWTSKYCPCIAPLPRQCLDHLCLQGFSSPVLEGLQILVKILQMFCVFVSFNVCTYFRWNDHRDLPL